MRKRWQRQAWVLLAAIAGCAQGEPAVDPALLAAHRERLMLSEEPEDVLGVLDVRELLARPGDTADGPSDATESAEVAVLATRAESSDAAMPTSVVVVGRIGGIPNPWKRAQPGYPWSTGQAQFVIADASAAAEIEDHGHAHDDPDHDCPFCAASATSDAIAVVRFRDDSGQVIPIDARRVFDLKGEETVVVRGRAQIVGQVKDGVLVIEADGLYVRR